MPAERVHVKHIRAKERCECCDDPATCHDADGIPLCDGCMKQLIFDSRDEEQS